MSDAAHVILTQPTEFSGKFCIDEDLLREHGVTDFDKYMVSPGVEPMPDFFV
jgi:citronellol/citronellal dehydrogenase